MAGGEWRVAGTAYRPRDEIPPWPGRGVRFARAACWFQTARIQAVRHGRGSQGRLGTTLAGGWCVVLSILRLFPSRERRRQVLGILRSMQGPTQAQPHCLNCRLYEEDGYEEGILYVEQWDSEPELQRHIRSEAYRRVLEAVELSRSSPEIQFHIVSETKGIEMIEGLRGEGQPEAEPR